MQWTSRLKDVQAIIGRRLFEAKVMDKRLKQLSRYADWLASNKTSDGWDIEVSAKADTVLFRPDPLQMRPQPDTNEADTANSLRLLEAVARMPKQRKTHKASLIDASPQEVISESMDEVDVILEPQEAALQDLIQHLDSAGEEGGPKSLVEWKRARRELDGVTDEQWLLYAAIQLRTSDYVTAFLSERQVDEFPINESFFDVEVRRLEVGAD